MPRTGRKELEAASRARIRLLLRNPDFQEEFNKLRRVVPGLPMPEQLAKVAKFEDKWGVPFLAKHPRVFFEKRSDLSDKIIKDFEPILTSNVQSDRLLQGLIDSLTRKAKIALRKKGYRLSRQHSKKIDFYLQVFDLRRKGKSFRSIAEATGKKLSAVKMAHKTAVRMVLGPLRAQTKRHFQKCSLCKSGKPCKELNALIDRLAGVSKGSRLIPVGGAPEVYQTSRKLPRKVREA